MVFFFLVLLMRSQLWKIFQWNLDQHQSQSLGDFVVLEQKKKVTSNNDRDSPVTEPVDEGVRIQL